MKVDVNDLLRNYGCDALRDDIDARSRPYEPNGVGSDDWPSISFIDPATWHGKPIPERQWLIQDLIPAANVTLLTGHGGAGKTTLALQLASAVALGGYWLDYKLEQGPVMAVCCEDDEPELHRRLACITDRLGGSLIDLRSRFQLATMAGRDALLGVPDRGLIVPTPLFEEISCQAIAMRPKLIVIDNAADVYGGDENSRSMVRQFITLLRGLAVDTDAAVRLTLHPSLTGIQTGTGMSGNTAWFNGPRAQLYLKAAATEQGDEPDCGLRELEARKNNYGPLAAKMLLRWRDGVFLVEPGAGASTSSHLSNKPKRSSSLCWTNSSGRVATLARTLDDPTRPRCSPQSRRPWRSMPPP